jgi:hypothetical protein
MTLLIAGLAIFLGVHLLPAMPPARLALVARWGDRRYRAVFSLASAAGLALIVAGYALSGDRVRIFEPLPMPELAPRDTLSFILLAAAAAGPLRRRCGTDAAPRSRLVAGPSARQRRPRRNPALRAFLAALVDLASAAGGAVKSFDPMLKRRMGRQGHRRRARGDDVPPRAAACRWLPSASEQSLRGARDRGNGNRRRGHGPADRVRSSPACGNQSAPLRCAPGPGSPRPAVPCERCRSTSAQRAFRSSAQRCCAHSAGSGQEDVLARQQRRTPNRNQAQIPSAFPALTCSTARRPPRISRTRNAGRYGQCHSDRTGHVLQR